MNRRTRKKFDMVRRAVVFVREHPDATDGGQAAILKLEALAAEADQLADAENQGRHHSHSAVARKQEARRRIRSSLLPHLANAGKLAEADVPGLAAKFVFPREAHSDAAFLSAARSIYADAVANKDVLVKRGLSDTVMTALDAALQDMTAAIEDGAASRQLHVGAHDRSEAVAAEITKLVSMVDALNRHRFAGDDKLLGEWKTASDVIAEPVRSAPAETPAPAPAATPPVNASEQGSEARPAA